MVLNNTKVNIRMIMSNASFQLVRSASGIITRIAMSVLQMTAEVTRATT